MIIIFKYGLIVHFNQEAEVFFFCFIIISACHDSFRVALPAVSMLLANKVQFAHKLDQVVFQLDRSQLLYLEHRKRQHSLVPQEAAQPSTTIVPQEATQPSTTMVPQEVAQYNTRKSPPQSLIVLKFCKYEKYIKIM